MADAKGDPSDNKQPMLSTVYQELCSSYRATDDFRAKLLGFLPLASGTGIFLLLSNDFSNDFSRQKEWFLLPIGLFGIGVTLGLFVLELRGIQKCHAYIQAGKEVEKQLLNAQNAQGHFTQIPKELPIFLRGPKGHKGSTEDSNSPYWTPPTEASIGTFMAARLIYTTVFAGWVFVAFLGLFTIISTMLQNALDNMIVVAIVNLIEVEIVNLIEVEIVTMAAVGIALLSCVGFFLVSGIYLRKISEISTQIQSRMSEEQVD